MLGVAAVFADRADAGRRLADLLPRDPQPPPVVLALPRGGVPVAVPVAAACGGELDVLVVRKLGAPGNREYAIGAVGEGGARVVDEGAVRSMRLSEEDLAALVSAEEQELRRRVLAYRGTRPAVPVAGRPVVIVDDGMATGSSMAVAVQVARHLGASRVTVAVPVGSWQAVAMLRGLADEVVCAEVPESFMAVGVHYDDFAQVDDAAVVGALAGRP